MHKEDHIADLIKEIALIAGKNSFLTGAVARFKRVKYIKMARIQEQLSVFSHDKRVVAANGIRPRKFCIAVETFQFKVNRDGFHSGRGQALMEGRCAAGNVLGG